MAMTSKDTASNDTDSGDGRGSGVGTVTATADRAASSAEPSRASSFGLARRWGGRLRVAIGVVLVMYIWLVVNLIAFRHPTRVDFTAERQHTLTPETKSRLDLVSGEIRVVIPTFLQRENPDHVVQHKVLSRARHLLTEYMAQQPLIKLVAEIDILREPERWTELQNVYDLTVTQTNRFIFMTGPANEFRQSVTPKDLAIIGVSADPRINEPEVTRFRGQKAITDAISRLVLRERKPVYVTQDKSELALEPKSVQDPGLRAWKRELETSGYAVSPLSLSAVDAIPNDCQLLVIARPQNAYSAAEIKRIETYLEGGGRLLVALGPQYTGIEDLLSRWAVSVESGAIMERRLLGTARQDSSEPVVNRFNPTHAITAPFREAARFATVLFAPRPLEPGGMERGLEAESLLDLPSSLDPGTSYYHVNRRDAGASLPRPGDFSVACAVQQHVPDRLPTDFHVLPTRIVVLGSASLFGDARLPQFSHRDFLLNCVHWLVGDESKSTTGGDAWVKRTMKKSPGIRRFLFWAPPVLFPGVCLIMGIFVYMVRRS